MLELKYICNYTHIAPCLSCINVPLLLSRNTFVALILGSIFPFYFTWESSVSQLCGFCSMLLSFRHRQLSSLCVAWASQMGAASRDLVEGPPGGVSGAQRVMGEA